MDKFTQKTNDGTALNIAALKNLFPEVVSEGKVDFDALKTILGGEVAGDERYQFTWAGKRAAMLEASTPITKTLRPCIAESKDWETTKNIFIEGDNLDALKILQNTYGGKVKMIYIDPPYNTGHDFIYHDNFHGTKAVEDIMEGIVDDETGERLKDSFKQNTEANGYFHSDWCSMMYPRLKLARNLLAEEGVIFISIDDNEIVNARRLCDEVFGECNAIAQCVWEKMYTTKNDAGSFSECHEYVLIYARDYNAVNIALLPRTAEMDARYVNSDNDSRGPWKPIPLSAKGERKNGRYPVVSPLTGKEWYPDPDSHWLYRREDTEKMIADHRIYFGKDGNAKPNVKRFLTEVQQGTKVKTLWKYDEVGSNDSAKRELRALYDEKFIPFSFPKPTTLIDRMLTIIGDEGAIVLDFFSGSGTTAHAVLSRNERDKGNRKFIMVQLPEVCAKDSEAVKAGYKNICEIGKERIRRAGEKIKVEHPLTTQNLDVGFRVFKVDSSNLEDVFFRPADYQQDHLLEMINNVKTGRTGLDLLFGCLLEWGLPIDLPTKARTDLGTEVYDVGGGRILACFDMNVTEAVVRAIAAETPDFAIFRDLSFTSSADKINVAEIFKTLSPNTKVKVL